MNARFRPAKLSAAIMTLSLMSAPFYLSAQETDEQLERSVEDRPAIEERSSDTQQAAEEIESDTEQAAAEAESETEQAAAEIESESEQAWEETEEETEQAAAEVEQETEQAAAEVEQETEQAAAEAEQETEELAANDTEEATAKKEELSGPMEDVQEGVAVLQSMEQDADMQQLLDRAKGVFLVPDYATAALIVGASGGEGILLKKQEDGQWSNPVFYNIGSLTGGLQAGAAAGSIAMVLLSDQSLESFQNETNFGFTADAGYSIINWSDRARAEIGMGTDVVMWTDTEGLFGDLAVGITGINPDEDEISEYYGQEAQPQNILAGDVENPHEQMLQQALREEQ